MTHWLVSAKICLVSLETEQRLDRLKETHLKLIIILFRGVLGFWGFGVLGFRV